MAHVFNITIPETYLDSLGHVNNAKYLELYEQARWGLLNEKGYGLEQIKKNQQAPVVINIDISFRKELLANIPIQIFTETVSYIGKIFVLKQKIVDEAQNVCSTATVTGGFFDLQTRKLIRPSAQWLQVFDNQWQERRTS